MKKPLFTLLAMLLVTTTVNAKFDRSMINALNTPDWTVSNLEKMPSLNLTSKTINDDGTNAYYEVKGEKNRGGMVHFQTVGKTNRVNRVSFETSRAYTDKSKLLTLKELVDNKALKQIASPPTCQPPATSMQKNTYYQWTKAGQPPLFIGVSTDGGSGAEGSWIHIAKTRNEICD